MRRVSDEYDSRLSIQGTGDAVVLVPGMDGTGQLFYRQAPRLARSSRVGTYALRGKVRERVQHDERADALRPGEGADSAPHGIRMHSRHTHRQEIRRFLELTAQTSRVFATRAGRVNDPVRSGATRASLQPGGDTSVPRWPKISA